MKIGKEILLTFGARASVIGGTLIINFVLGRYFGGDVLGQYISLYSLILLCSLLSRLGADTYLVKEVGAQEKINFDTQLKVISFVAGSIVTVLVFSSIALWISGRFFFEKNLLSYDFVLPFVFASLFMTINYVFSAGLKGLRKSYLAPFFESGACLLVVSFVAYAFYIKNIALDVKVLIWITVFAACLQSFLGSIFSRVFFSLTVLSSLSYQNVIINYKESLTFFPIALAGYLNQWGGVVVMAGFLAASDLGIWNAAQKTAYLIIFILMVFNSVLSPRYARLSKDGELGRLERFSKAMTAIMCVIAFPVFLIFLLFSKNIMFIYGEEFVVGAVALLIMSFAQAFNLSTGSVGILLNMSGQQRLVSITTCVVAALNVGSLVLVGKLSPTINSVAVVAALTIVLQNLVFLILVKKTLGFWNIPILKGWSLNEKS